MKKIYFKIIYLLYTRQDKHIKLAQWCAVDGSKVNCLRDAFYAILLFNFTAAKFEYRNYKRWFNSNRKRRHY